LILLVAGCGVSTYHIADDRGNYLGTVAIGKQTLDGGSVAYTHDAWNKNGQYVNGNIVAGSGLLPAVIQGGAIVGGAYVLHPDVNVLSQGQGQEQGQSQYQKQKQYQKKGHRE